MTGERRRCDYCAAWREDDGRPCPSCGAAKPLCEGCRRRVASWSGLVQEGDGRWVCSDCHQMTVRGRDSRPAYHCTEPGCTKTAGDHVQEFRHIVTTAAWRDRFASHREPSDAQPAP